MKDPHVAIGTSALAVAANAFANLIQHARAGTVKWPCALVFGASGVIGALIGSTLGKMVAGQHLLVLFAGVMIVVGFPCCAANPAAATRACITRPIAVRLVAIGLLAGLLSGFIGIGGGFLIVPGIMLGSGMPILNAVGSSLFSVGTFGSATALNYALSGLVDWRVAGFFIAGGVAGGVAGMQTAIRLADHKGLLTRIFAFVLLAVAAYMLFRSLGGIGG
jgi:uncharacterized membrane protein YfcA